MSSPKSNVSVAWTQTGDDKFPGNVWELPVAIFDSADLIEETETETTDTKSDNQAKATAEVETKTT